MALAKAAVTSLCDLKPVGIKFYLLRRIISVCRDSLMGFLNIVVLPGCSAALLGYYYVIFLAP